MGLFEELEQLDSVAAARRLVGCEVVRNIDGYILRGKIVETEAYDQADAASHSFNGMTPRSEVMFGPAGHWYVYFTYGMHYCCNVVVGPEGYGAAVLIRAIEPLEGQETMKKFRQKHGYELTNGPAKFCQAFSIDKTVNGWNAESSDLKVTLKEPVENIVISTRIGISKAKDEPWRFHESTSKWVSKP